MTDNERNLLIAVAEFVNTADHEPIILRNKKIEDLIRLVEKESEHPSDKRYQKQQDDIQKELGRRKGETSLKNTLEHKRQEEECGIPELDVNAPMPSVKPPKQEGILSSVLEGTLVACPICLSTFHYIDIE